jgi:hypothetical protein
LYQTLLLDSSFFALLLRFDDPAGPEPPPGQRTNRPELERLGAVSRGDLAVEASVSPPPAVPAYRAAAVLSSRLEVESVMCACSPSTRPASWTILACSRPSA